LFLPIRDQTLHPYKSTADRQTAFHRSCFRISSAANVQTRHKLEIDFFTITILSYIRISENENLGTHQWISIP
jgi:hypothetical protein